jgi:hypothetical protein
MGSSLMVFAARVEVTMALAEAHRKCAVLRVQTLTHALDAALHAGLTPEVGDGDT